jgi:hypothetical protein
MLVTAPWNGGFIRAAVEPVGDRVEVSFGLDTTFPVVMRLLATSSEDPI